MSVEYWSMPDDFDEDLMCSDYKTNLGRYSGSVYRYCVHAKGHDGEHHYENLIMMPEDPWWLRLLRQRLRSRPPPRPRRPLRPGQRQRPRRR